MKIVLVSPYLPTAFGGGERYLLDTALGFSQLGHQVQVAIPASALVNQSLTEIKTSYQNFLGVSLAKIEFISSPLFTSAHWFTKLWWTKQFGLLFYLTDGSLFFSLAKINVLHIQVPLILNKRSFLERLKLRQFTYKITNSDFTRQIVSQAWPVKIDFTHHPQIMVAEIANSAQSVPKQKVILHVGRFFTHLHAKRQDILIEIWQRLVTKYPALVKGWKLVLIGPVENQAYATKIAKMAKGWPIEIYHQVSRQQLVKWYQRASIYWHATGYRINEQLEPQKLEHFGITTLEAMAGGAVPVVLGKGGQLEVVGDQLKSWTWLTQLECLKKTVKLIRYPELRLHLSQLAQAQAQQFGSPKFYQLLTKLLQPRS